MQKKGGLICQSAANKRPVTVEAFLSTVSMNRYNSKASLSPSSIKSLLLSIGLPFARMPTEINTSHPLGIHHVVAWHGRMALQSVCPVFLSATGE